MYGTHKRISIFTAACEDGVAARVVKGLSRGGSRCDIQCADRKKRCIMRESDR